MELGSESEDSDGGDSDGGEDVLSKEAQEAAAQSFTFGGPLVLMPSLLQP